MRDLGLKDYYEQELRYLREMGSEFAQQHSEIAAGLRLEANRCDDPHVERLLEGVAFLAARVHRRIDDDFSDICQALLSVVYPHYLRPIPSVSIIQFHPDKGAPGAGYTIPAGSELVAPPADKVRCRFRTAYDTTIWPLEIREAEWVRAHALELGSAARDMSAALRVRLACTGEQTFADLELDTLRLYLDGDFGLASALYEALDNKCGRVLVRPPGQTDPALEIPGARLESMGFEDDEGLLPYPGRSFLGYRLLLEHFTFPQKFLFMDLGGLNGVCAEPFGSEVDVLFLVGELEGTTRHEILQRSVTRETVRLGCTPMVNLFEAQSEPIALDQRRSEYLIRARGPTTHPHHVFSVDEVSAVTPKSPTRIPFQPFYSYRHRGQDNTEPMFWHSKRVPSTWMEGGGTDVMVAFVDLKGDTLRPPYPSAMAGLTVFNGDLPSRLQIARDQGGNKDDWDLHGGGAPLARIQVLMHPTKSLQPPLDGSLLWRLVSQLSLNYLSLVDNGGDALRELLRLYNFGDFEQGEKHIRGITRISCEPWYGRVRSTQGISFARGRHVHVEFDEDQYSGGGIYLLASVLERFLSLYASMNSFSKLRASVRSRNRTYTLREWEPRAGTKTLM